jgi:hypothetical protein
MSDVASDFEIPVCCTEAKIEEHLIFICLKTQKIDVNKLQLLHHLFMSLVHRATNLYFSLYNKLINKDKLIQADVRTHYHMKKIRQVMRAHSIASPHKMLSITHESYSICSKKIIEYNLVIEYLERIIKRHIFD